MDLIVAGYGETTAALCAPADHSMQEAPQPKPS